MRENLYGHVCQRDFLLDIKTGIVYKTQFPVVSHFYFRCVIRFLIHDCGTNLKQYS